MIPKHIWFTLHLGDTHTDLKGKSKERLKLSHRFVLTRELTRSDHININERCTLHKELDKSIDAINYQVENS